MQRFDGKTRFLLLMQRFDGKTRFLLLMQRFDGKAGFKFFCHTLKLYMILYSRDTVFFHCYIVSSGIG